MAVSNLAAISSALSLEFEKDIARQSNRQSQTLAKLMAKSSGGKSLNWDVSLGGQTAAAFSEGADVSSGELLIDAKTPAILSWGRYRSAFGLSELQLAAALSSSNSAIELKNLMSESVFESVSSLASKMNQDFFVGSSQIIGLNSALILTGTYATISATSNALWRSNVLANGGTPRALTFALMDAAETACFTASGMRPDLIVMGPALFTTFRGLFTNTNTNLPTVGKLDVSADADSIFYQGIRVIRDKDCPANTAYFLNTQAVQMRYLPMPSFGDAVSFQVRVAAGSSGLQGDSQSTGIPVTITPLAKTGDSVKFQCVVNVQAMVKRPGACAVLGDVQ